MRIVPAPGVWLALVLFMPLWTAAQERPTVSGVITILHTNDSHGRYRFFPVAPGNATAQTGDPGRQAQSFARRGEVNGFARLAGERH